MQDMSHTLQTRNFFIDHIPKELLFCITQDMITIKSLANQRGPYVMLNSAVGRYSKSGVSELSLER